MDGPETLRVINSDNRILLIEMLINSELSNVHLTLEICVLLKIHVLENRFYGSFGKFFWKNVMVLSMFHSIISGIL